ncbi:MAG TPA: hypothetical protein PKH07_04575 [bacterium]|nr:hypothetical protein [bacterium]
MALPENAEQTQSGGTYAVVRDRFEPWDFMRVSEVLEHCLGLHVLDARQLARRAPGIVAEAIPGFQAERLAQNLRSVGTTTIIVPTRLLMPLPVEFQCRGMVFQEGRLCFLGEDDRKSIALEPEAFTILCAAQVFREKEVGLSTTAKAFVYATMGYSRIRVQDVPITSKGSKETWPFVLCLVGNNPPIQVRIYADKFNFSCLERHQVERTEDAFPHLVKRLSECCPSVKKNPGVDALLQGKPLKKSLRFGKERDFEDYAHWFLQVSLLV